MKKTLLLFSLVTLVSSALVGCSGGEKGEMAPLSDDELLKRASQGREQGEQGSRSNPAANAPAANSN